MTAMLTEQLAHTPLSTPHVVTDHRQSRVEENRRSAEKQLAFREGGCFATYSSEHLVSRPGVDEFFYAVQYGGFYSPEETAIPICFKDFDDKIVFGLFHAVGIKQSGLSGPPRCWVVEGTLILEDGRQLPVKGRFDSITYGGEVMPDTSKAATA